LNNNGNFVAHSVNAEALAERGGIAAARRLGGALGRQGQSFGAPEL
jgi:hypothetical protein